MKKVLIVSPHFPPINAPDMQRVRLALPHLRAQGWEPTVLAVAPESIEGGVREPLLERTYPADVRIVRVAGISPQRTRWLGVGNLWWRCGRALTQAGDRLLAQETFDLVFISTTQFDAFTLGPRWRERFGVPFVVDYQDPWLNDYYERTGTTPPGGRLRYALSQRRAKRAEPPVLRAAAGVIAVSDAYPAMLARHHRWFDPARVVVLPFGAAEADLAAARDHRPAEPLVDFEDGNVHHVYAGRCGPDMAEALRILFRGFRTFRESGAARAARMRFHFIGTGYAPPPLGEDTVLPVARAEGVADVVHEHRYRVPYFDALSYLQRAQALVAVGSDDASYSASKLFPYLLARRPLALVFHAASPVLRMVEDLGGGLAFPFPGERGADVAAQLAQRWFSDEGYRRVVSLNETAFARYAAASLTAQLAAVFDRAAAK